MEQFKSFVEIQCLGKQVGYEAPQMNASGGDDRDEMRELYQPFQTSTSEATFRQFEPKVN